MKEAKPEPDLCELFILRVFQVKNDRMDAVGVADEVVVQHVVVLVAGKLPDAQVSNGSKFALKSAIQ